MNALLKIDKGISYLEKVIMIIAIIVMSMELAMFIRPPVERRSFSDSRSHSITNPLSDTSRMPPRLTPLCANVAFGVSAAPVT